MIVCVDSPSLSSDSSTATSPGFFKMVGEEVLEYAQPIMLVLIPRAVIQQLKDDRDQLMIVSNPDDSYLDLTTG